MPHAIDSPASQRRGRRLVAHVCLGAALVSLAACLGCGGSTGESTSDGELPGENLHARAEEALERGIRALVREQEVQIVDVWLAQQILKNQPHDELAQWVERGVAAAGDTAAAIALRPTASRVLLPEDPGTGLEMWTVYRIAPFGRPAPRALRYLEALAAADLARNQLVDQYATLVLAEDTGVEMPTDLVVRRTQLLSKIVEEQERAEQFDYLFAARASIVLRDASPDRDEARRNVRVILDAQNSDGTWSDVKPLKTIFDGEEMEAVPLRTTTTAAALYALSTYLKKY